MSSFAPRLMSISAMTLFAIACNSPDYTLSEKPQDESTDQSVVEPSSRISVTSATPVECAAGGNVYSVFKDRNENGVFDLEEAVISRQVVCNGQNGQNGYSMVFETVAATTNICPAGGNVLLMALDIAGLGVYDITFPNQKSITVCNGQNGQNARITGFTPVEAIQACGNMGGGYREILLRLSNGQILASFSEDTGGTMTRLTLLPDGTFMNTDSSGCVFSLSTTPDGLTRSISWNGSVQLTWNVIP